jgi:two-component system, NarL family, sensor histidine kinase UhpB
MICAPDSQSPQYVARRGSVGRDLAWLAVITLAAAGLAIQLEWSEKFFALTRGWEHFQLDEAPTVLLALASCLSWFAWRRYEEARAELAARKAAEAKLETVLDAHRRLSQQYVHVQEFERKALARELHDELGQYLNAIKTDAVSLHAHGIVQHADHVHGVVRDLIRRLRPVALDTLGLRAALEHFLDEWQQRTPRVAVQVSLEGDLDNLDEQLSLTLFRLVQESLTNIVRHSGAKRVNIEIARHDAEVIFSITDDGAGANMQEQGTGLGLIGMRERVEMLGGQLRITTAPGHGFSIHARVRMESVS